MSKTNAVAKKTETDLAPMPGFQSPVEYDYEGNFKDRINFNGKLGQYENTLDDTSTKNVDVIIIKAHQIRWLFNKLFSELKKGEESEVVCRSQNGYESEVGKNCSDCPNGQWVGDTKPSCNLGTELTVQIGNNEYLLTVKGVSIKPLNNYFRLVEKSIGRPINSVVTRLGAVEHDNGLCYQMTLNAVEAVEPKEQPKTGEAHVDNNLDEDIPFED